MSRYGSYRGRRSFNLKIFLLILLLLLVIVAGGYIYLVMEGRVALPDWLQQEAAVEEEEELPPLEIIVPDVTPEINEEVEPEPSYVLEPLVSLSAEGLLSGDWEEGVGTVVVLRDFDGVSMTSSSISYNVSSQASAFRTARCHRR